MKRRAWSLLLAATLVISSLPLNAFSVWADEAVQEEMNVEDGFAEEELIADAAGSLVSDTSEDVISEEESAVSSENESGSEVGLIADDGAAGGEYAEDGIPYEDVSVEDIPGSESDDLEELYVYDESDETEEELEAQSIEEDTEAAFEQSVCVDGVTVTVTAEEGVFPEDANLSVTLLTRGEQKTVEELVDDIREEAVKVAVSYSFDIKVVDGERQEIPLEKKEKVKLDKI